MAIAVNSGTAVGGSGTNNLNIVPTAPSSVANDLLVAVIMYDKTRSLTAPSGWTLIGSVISDGYVSDVAVFTSPGGSSPVTTWKQSGSSYPSVAMGQIYCIDTNSGANIVSLDNTAVGNVAFNTVNVVSPSVTAFGNADVVMSVVIGYTSGGSTVTAPSGYTSLVSFGSDNSRMGVAWDQSSSAGTQSSATWVYSTSVSEGRANVFAFATSVPPPTANAGTAQTVTALSSVTLTGTDTFASGHSGTVAWSAVTAGAPSITAGASTLSATIGNTGAPQTPTAYTYELTVTQDDSQQATSTTTITVNPPPMFRASSGVWTGVNTAKRANGGTWN